MKFILFVFSAGIFGLVGALLRPDVIHPLVWAPVIGIAGILTVSIIEILFKKKL